MADDNMPLMLDDGMNGTNGTHGAMDGPMQVDHLDVDDLFGEGEPLTLPNVRLPSKKLYQRVDNLRLRGCCQTLAWSKSGTIASVTPDGTSVQVRYLRTDPADGSWGLGDPTTVDLVTGSPSNPIVHLAWAATNNHELAVIDSVGRVAILAFSITLNRPFLTRKWDADQPDDLHAVAGCFWLHLPPQNKNYHVYHGPAVKDGNSYRYESSFVHAYGPWHPNSSKSALLCVTTNGLLRLFWTQSNNRLEETTLELESISSSDDLVTHASLHSDKNFMYIALATASKQLRLVRVSISWGPPQTDTKLPPGGHTLSPTMQAKNLAVTSWLPSGPTASPTDSSMTQLSQLELLPSQLSDGGQTWLPVKVLVVRSYLPTNNATPFQEVQTIVDQWELINEALPALHSAFEQMGNRKNSSANTAEKDPNRLKRLDPVVIHKVVIGVQTIHLGRIVCFSYSDGTVDFRDRVTLQEVYNDTNLERVMTLSHVGFTFAEEPGCLQAALSPTSCSVIQMLEDGTVKWNPLRYLAGDIGNSTQDAPYAAVVAALTVAASAASYYGVNCDDILAVARPFAEKKTFIRDWVHEIVRMIKVGVDYSDESHHNTLVGNNNLQLCLSIINHLGFKGEFKPRSCSGKFVQLALNIRNVIVLISVACNTPGNMRDKLSPLDDHEVVETLASCVKWSLDLLSYLADSLFELLEDEGFASRLNPTRFSELSAYLQGKSNPSLQLLTCSSTRGLLSALCRRVLHMDTLSVKAIEFYERRAALQNATDPSGQAKAPQVLLYGAYKRIQQLTSDSASIAKLFDRLLNTLSNDIRSAYKSAFASLAAQNQKKEGAGAGVASGKQFEAQIKSAQHHSELNMLLSAQPLPPFLPVLRKLFEQDLRVFRAQSDPAKLFFAEYSLVEADDVPRIMEERRQHRRYVDVFRRVEITLPPSASAEKRSNRFVKEEEGEEKSRDKDGGVGSWRRCVRCAAVMEDIMGSRPGFTFVLTQQRRCSCGGYWALLPTGSSVA